MMSLYRMRRRSVYLFIFGAAAVILSSISLISNLNTEDHAAPAWTVVDHLPIKRSLVSQELDIKVVSSTERDANSRQPLLYRNSNSLKEVSLNHKQSAILEHEGHVYVFRVEEEESDTLIPSSDNAEIADGIPFPFPNRDGTNTQIETSYLRYLISGIAHNDTIIIVPTNTAFIRLALNLNCRMRTLGINNVLFWALDKRAADILEAYNIPAYFNPSYYSSMDQEWYHSGNYIKMMLERPKFWRMIMKTGTNMLFLDADTAVISNPMAELVGDADLEGEIDAFNLTVAKNRHKCPQLCGGAFFLKANHRSILFLDRVEKALAEEMEGVVDDQQAINYVIHNYEVARILNRYQKGKEVPYGGFPEDPEDDRLTVRFVPIERFMNGHIWFTSVSTTLGTNTKSGMTMVFTQKGFEGEFEPALMHLNGITSKESTMKRFGWWWLQDDLGCPLS